MYYAKRDGIFYIVAKFSVFPIYSKQLKYYSAFKNVLKTFFTVL